MATPIAIITITDTTAGMTAELSPRLSSWRDLTVVVGITMEAVVTIEEMDGSVTGLDGDITIDEDEIDDTDVIYAVDIMKDSLVKVEFGAIVFVSVVNILVVDICIVTSIVDSEEL